MQNYVEIGGFMGRVISRMGTRNFLEGNFPDMKLMDKVVGQANAYEKALFAEEVLAKMDILSSLFGFGDVQEKISQAALISGMISNQVKSRFPGATFFDFFELKSNGFIVGMTVDELMDFMEFETPETLNAQTPLGDGINSLLRMMGHHPQPGD